MYFYNNSSDVGLLGNLLRTGMGRRRITCADLPCCPVYSPYISLKSWFGKCALLGLCPTLHRSADGLFHYDFVYACLKSTHYTRVVVRSVNPVWLSFMDRSRMYVIATGVISSIFLGIDWTSFFFLFCVCCKGLFPFIKL